MSPWEKVCFVQTTRINLTRLNLDETIKNAAVMKEDPENEDSIYPNDAETTMSNIGATTAVHGPIQTIVGWAGLLDLLNEVIVEWTDLFIDLMKEVKVELIDQ